MWFTLGKLALKTGAEIYKNKKKAKLLESEAEVKHLERAVAGEVELQKIKEWTNHSIGNELAVILSRLSGTTLFKEGVDIRFYKIEELEKINRELEEFPNQFFPRFIIIGYDYAGDFLVLYIENTNVHFGILDHAAWGVVDC